MSTSPSAARPLAAIFAVVASLAIAACSKTPAEQPTESKSSAAPAAPPPVTLSARLSRPAPERLVAIGDLHGDFEMARKALRLAGAVDANDAWVGGKLVVVQTGDEIDRGDGDRKILDLFEKLKDAAKRAGGEVIALSGNHEIMNAAGDFRYVTDGGLGAFADIEPHGGEMAARVAAVDEHARHRAAAFAPGGPYATLLAERPIMVKVGDTVFVHGGVLPKHVTYGLDKMDDAVHAWLLGKQPNPPSAVVSEDGPIWTRAYSEDPGEKECGMLTEALRMLGAKRMVMGHTVQRSGISSACGRKAWRIDVGMSHFYGGPLEVLEIKGDDVTVVKPGQAANL